MWKDTVYIKVNKSLGAHGGSPNRKSNVVFRNIPGHIRQISQIEFQEGLPNFEVFDGKERTLLVLDDLMNETDERVTKIFTKISHHRNVSVLYLTQNLFYNGKHTRTISLNAHYLVLFKNVRDTTQVANLARQMFPGQSHFMLDAFRDATSIPLCYLLVDLRPDTVERCRLRTNIFPGETHYVYVRK